MKIKSIFIILGLSLCLNIHAYGYELEMTTYYPAPYGIYEQLQADKLAVGDINEDGKLTGGDIPEDGALAVEDNIYLGKDIVESNRSPEMVVKTPDARPTPFNADTADSDQTVLSIKDKDNKNLFNVDDTGFVEARDYQFIDAVGNKIKISDIEKSIFIKQCYWEGMACTCYEEEGGVDGYAIVGQNCFHNMLGSPVIIKMKITDEDSDCPESPPDQCDLYYNIGGWNDFFQDVAEDLCDDFGLFCDY